MTEYERERVCILAFLLLGYSAWGDGGVCGAAMAVGETSFLQAAHFQGICTVQVSDELSCGPQCIDLAPFHTQTQKDVSSMEEAYPIQKVDFTQVSI